MNAVLEKDQQDINNILMHTAKVAEGYYAQQQELPPSLHISDLPYTALPEQGMGAQAVLSYFAKHHAPYMANSAAYRHTLA